MFFFSLLTGFLGWWRFRFRVVDGELQVEHGIFSLRRVFLHKERIQAIDVSAGILQRIFGLVRVQVKSGAAGVQAEFSALSVAQAEWLRQQLGHSSSSTDPLQKVESPPIRHVMTRGELLLAASTSGQLGVILAAVAWFNAKAGNFLQERLIETLERADQHGLPLFSHSLSIFIALGVASLILVWVLAALGTILRYGGFSVERRGQELVVRRGLLEKKEVTITVDRVQAVRIVENLPRQLLGYGALYVESAGHAEEQGKSTFLHPCLNKTSWLPMLQSLLPEFAVEPPLERPPRRALRRFLLFPLLISTTAASLAAWFLPYGWIAFAYPVLRLLLGLLEYRDMGLGTTERAVVLRSRGLTRNTAIAPLRAVQFVTTTRSWFQRRRKVASIEIGVASGASGRRFEVRELDDGLAERFLSTIAPRT
jgi:putative membrane protein